MPDEKMSLTKLEWLTGAAIVGMVVLMLALMLTGCEPGIADVIKAASTDPATVCVRVQTVYPPFSQVIEVGRSGNPAGGGAVIDPQNGCAINHGPTPLLAPKSSAM